MVSVTVFTTEDIDCELLDAEDNENEDEVADEVARAAELDTEDAVLVLASVDAEDSGCELVDFADNETEDEVLDEVARAAELDAEETVLVLANVDAEDNDCEFADDAIEDDIGDELLAEVAGFDIVGPVPEPPEPPPHAEQKIIVAANNNGLIDLYK